MNKIFTISTFSHLYKSLALRDSLNVFGFELEIFVVDNIPDNKEFGSSIRSVQKMDNNAIKAVLKKFKNNLDKQRWALKPVLIHQLLKENNHKVIYVDNDIFFFDSPQFLFDKLEHSSCILTPHFYPSNPSTNQNWLEANFRVGLYNAGFIAVNSNAIPMLNWWSSCCLYNVKQSYWRGLFDDQKYLDLVPVLFENVEILKNRGCNFAGWNCDEVDIELQNDNKLKINQDPLVFIHFTPLSFNRFSLSNSKLFPFYNQYLNALKKHNPHFIFSSSKWNWNAFSSYFYYIRWKFNRLFES